MTSITPQSLCIATHSVGTNTHSEKTTMLFSNVRKQKNPSRAKLLFLFRQHIWQLITHLFAGICIFPQEVVVWPRTFQVCVQHFCRVCMYYLPTYQWVERTGTDEQLGVPLSYISQLRQVNQTPDKRKEGKKKNLSKLPRPHNNTTVPLWSLAVLWQLQGALLRCFQATLEMLPSHCSRV